MTRAQIHRQTGVWSGLILLFAAACLGGCSSYTAPEVRVLDVSMGELSDEGIELVLELQAENPNNVAIPLREVHTTLFIDGRQVFSGLRSPELTLPASMAHRMQVPIAFSYERLGLVPQGVHKYRLSGTMVYELPGRFRELLFDSNIRRPRTSFGEQGTIDFARPLYGPEEIIEIPVEGS